MKTEETTVIIVGAGLAGIGLSCYLAKHGIEHLLLEKSDRVGGIWSRFDWPGLRCDTAILNYSYSFRPYLSRRSMASGAEISAYLQATAAEFGVLDRTRFETRVRRANFCQRRKRWRIETSRGPFRARFLVNANGYFARRPYVPRFQGSENFNGDISHLFDIDRHADLRHRSVLLVGSGASAISAAPALARRCRQLTLLQRSPSYIYEERDRIGGLGTLAQRLYRHGIRFPLAAVRWLQQLESDLVFVTFRSAPWLGKWFFRRHWRDTVDHDSWAEHLRPRYNPWEQRIAVAVGLKGLLRDAKIRLVTGRIGHFQPNGAVLEDGRHIAADTCILATGFNLRFFHFDIRIDGRSVDTRAINYYKNMMMGGIPNYFQPFGPPHTSFTGRIEAIARHVVKIILHMQRHGIETVSIARKRVRQRPRITPNYVIRNLADLPACYGCLQLPSIDNWLFYRFRPGAYRFDAVQAGHCDPTAPDRGILQPSAGEQRE